MFLQLSFAPHPNQSRPFVHPFQFNHDLSCLKRRMSVRSSFASSRNSNEDFAQNASTEIIRPAINPFYPSIWGDFFITYTPKHITNDARLEHAKKLKEVRRMLTNDPSDQSIKKISLIDSLQRLGVAYHFEREIEKALEQIYVGPDGFDDNHLYNVALLFRLLRQQGYNVSCEVFNRFKDSEGNFKEHLIDDVSGMLCLYEATHLRVCGEDILDEALEFTTTRLKSIFSDIKPPLATQVMHALRQPLHKGIPRLEARHYISVYQEDKTKDESILKFAKLDFNLVQSMHQQELCQLSIWWEELNLISKQSYARDRIVEIYYFAMAIHFEPDYAFARKLLAKLVALLVVADDYYDTYGTFEEVQLFQDAIERWDPSAIDGLPEYMKGLYSAFLDVYSETEEELRKDGRYYRVNYAKEALKTILRAYFTEVKWYNEGYIPTFEEYMQNGVITSAIIFLPFVCFVGMGDVVTKEAFDWTLDEPKLVKAASVLIRLTDDIVAQKFEQQMKRFCSAFDCYMKQYDVSEQEAYDELIGRVKEAWKDINQACMKPTAIPMPVLSPFINYARTMDVMYKNKDGFTDPYEDTEEAITSLFIDPISM